MEVDWALGAPSVGWAPGVPVAPLLVLLAMLACTLVSRPRAGALQHAREHALVASTALRGLCYAVWSVTRTPAPD